MFRPFRYQVVLILAILIGAVFVQILLNSYTKSIEKGHADALAKFHSDGVTRAEAGIDVYATLVSSIRSHIQNSDRFPDGPQMQSFLRDLVKDLDFNDSIVVNYLDSNHIFRYVVTPNEIDAPGLVGVDASKFRPEKEMAKLEKPFIDRRNSCL